MAGDGVVPLGGAQVGQVEGGVEGDGSVELQGREPAPSIHQLDGRVSYGGTGPPVLPSPPQHPLL